MSGATWSIDGEMLARPRSAATPVAVAPEPTLPADASNLLLDRIVIATGLDPTPCIQLLPCAAGARAPELAMGLALASAARLGRTLRIEAGTGRHVCPPPGAADVLPTERDALVPALHHGRLPFGLFDRHATGQPVAHWLAATSRAFRLVAIDCAALSASAEALALAPLCTGTVLLVEAGSTRLQEVNRTAHEVVRAGGRVLGTALVRVPRRMPRWLVG